MRHLRRFHCFIAVAEHLHFRKAAEAMSLTQPALSQQIRELESELNVPLFDRDRRSVTLTAAGERLLPAAREAVRVIDDAVADIARLSTNADTTVRFAFLEYLQLPFLPLLISDLREAAPNVKVELVPAHPNRIEAALEARDVDVGIALLPGTNEDLVYRSVMKGRWMLAVKHDHPLAEYDTIPRAALESQPLIFFDRSINPNLFKFTTDVIRSGGVEPQIAFEVTQASTGPQYAAQGLGAFFHASYIFQDMPSGVVRRPVEGFADMELGLVWRSTGRTTALNAFLDAAKRVVGELDRAP